MLFQVFMQKIQGQVDLQSAVLVVKEMFSKRVVVIATLIYLIEKLGFFKVLPCFYVLNVFLQTGVVESLVNKAKMLAHITCIGPELTTNQIAVECLNPLILIHIIFYPTFVLTYM